MSIADEEFFSENVGKINRSINRVLLFAIFVPVAFIIFTLLNIWVVPFDYSLILLGYTVFVAVFQLIINNATKKSDITHSLQIFSMYFGILATVGFVGILGAKGVIVVTISFAFPPFLSCLYYNRKFTNIVTVIDFIAVIFVTYLRSLAIFDTLSYKTIDYTSLTWFISNIIGITIEFVFVFFVCDRMNKRTHETLQKVFIANEEKEKAFAEIQKRNQYIIKVNQEVEEKNNALLDTQFKIIEFVSKCLGSHDLFTGQHVIHTKKYVEIICRNLKSKGFYSNELTEDTILLYVNAAFLHDIGKIHIPEGILNKVGKFTEEEFELMKSHSLEGKNLLEYLPKIEDGFFNEIAKQMAYCHHEKWDGTGYPQGLKEKQIPLSARIMAAADVLDALISKRLYKEPVSIDEAVTVFKELSGTHFEPCIAQAVIDCKDEIVVVDEEFKRKESVTHAEELEWWIRYHEGKLQK